MKKNVQNIREAVDSYLEFESTSKIYPFAIENHTEEQKQRIVDICASDETEDVHEACEKILGINPELL